MPILAGLLSSLLGWLGVTLADIFGRRVANAILVAGTFAVVFGALFALLRSTVNGLITAMPTDSWIAMGLGMAFPPMASTCIAAFGAVWAGCTLYRWQVKSLELMGR